MEQIAHGQKWRVASVGLAMMAILSSLVWASLPFSFYGLRGRSGVLYGEYTLLQTFSFHPLGWIWWALLGSQVFAALIAATNALSRSRRLMSFFALPAIGASLLNIYIASRWDVVGLWLMYVVGLFAPLLILAAGVCYVRARNRQS